MNERERGKRRRVKLLLAYFCKAHFYLRKSINNCYVTHAHAHAHTPPLLLFSVCFLSLAYSSCSLYTWEYGWVGGWVGRWDLESW